jgi:hypothetical protein
MCYYQEGKFDKDLLIADSENIYVSYPTQTSPIHPSDSEPVSHLIISPKYHYVSCLEIEEQVQNDLRNY